MVAIGHPFGLDRTATAGIVSGVGREIRAPDGFQIDEAIQTDAPINPGNSGGPLLDIRGRVVGVNAQIATAGNRGNVGIGFAVPANTVRDVVPRLSRGEPIVRPYLGVTTAPAPRGAAIQAVHPGGPAEREGLRAGDVIVGIDGRSVDEPEDVSDAVSAHRPGDEIEVEVIRDGERRTIHGRARQAAAANAVSFQAPWFLLLLLALPLAVGRLPAGRPPPPCGGGELRLPASACPRSRHGARAFGGTLPMVFYAVALTVAAIALARPEATVAVPEERAAVVLVTDVSGSMEARDVEPSRVAAARRAALRFLDRTPGAAAGRRRDVQPRRSGHRAASRRPRRGASAARAAAPQRRHGHRQRARRRARAARAGRRDRAARGRPGR